MANRAVQPPAAPRVTRDHLRYALLAGAGLATVGMAVTLAGIMLGPLFLPGVYLIGLGLLVLAVTGVVGAATAPEEPAGDPNRRRAAASPRF